jgi:hypothetical protein
MALRAGDDEAVDHVVEVRGSQDSPSLTTEGAEGTENANAMECWSARSARLGLTTEGTWNMALRAGDDKAVDHVVEVRKSERVRE